jgi:hypothetical protein
MIKLSQFRRILETATEKIPRDHPKLVESLRQSYPHCIELVSKPWIINTREDCFLFAFKDGFPADLLHAFEHLIDCQPHLYEQVSNKLISEGLLKLHDGKREGDKAVVYFDGNKPKHFGIIDQDKVISKWGKVHVWRHPLYEIPLSYGETVKYSDGQIDEDVLLRVIDEYKNDQMNDTDELI